ncbi:DUF3710 domain-containing protein [Paenarthrobacter sp. MSM-2-10-13]|uniref:DUF3710 domain-containing protein n=1 Tax=Paenarthrobacter sp. MSM-2-10-13 TaxID=2717318 RepID=UPI00141E73A7|nr:DUF3710 domain-containing protein [Paenarthrobacter sp. MSM-2-10-13]NHW48982.1 DUF3710 domain-containing protein [Paenarthrobacter sp. MSM-2-10-13]
MLFGRGKKSKDEKPETAGTVEESGTGASTSEPGGSGTPGDYRLGKGPLDIDEIENRDGYVDLGALLIAPAEGLQLRLEVEEATQRVVAVTMDLNGSSLQLQAFAAPRSEGLWDEIREQITQSVASQGGETEEVSGSFGTELVAKLPAEAADGSRGFRAARFMGVDGPRWFLRGVLGGQAALERDAAAGLEELFRKVVVVRGDNPMPPRELLQLRLPKDAAVPGQAGAPQGAVPPADPAMRQPERGPEITQIG